MSRLIESILIRFPRRRSISTPPTMIMDIIDGPAAALLGQKNSSSITHCVFTDWNI
jgi:hypothetical protein